MIEMRITTYNLCNDALGEILGGEVQFTIDALMSILREHEELVKSLKWDYFAIVNLLNTNNETLKELDKKLEKILPAIKEKHPDVFIGRVLCVGVESLADSSVVLRFIADVNEENIFSGKRILNKELKIAFDKAGITIPYPQVDVHSK